MAPLIGVLIFGLFAFWLHYTFGTADKRLKRRILKLPIGDTIAQTPVDEDVRVSGTLAYVEGKEPLIGPLSNRPCVAWRVIVEERRKQSEQRTWKTVIDESRSTGLCPGRRERPRHCGWDGARDGPRLRRFRRPGLLQPSIG